MFITCSISMDPYCNFYLGLFIYLFFNKKSFFFLLAPTLLGALRISLMPLLNGCTFWIIIFCFCAVSPVPVSFVSCSCRIWLFGNLDCRQPQWCPELVRRAFLLALGVTDWRFWCRLKLKRLAEMRPQRQRDMQVAVGFKEQFNHCWLQVY